MNLIYHYTSVDTLEENLQTKTIRFNRLDCVDDVKNAQLADMQNMFLYHVGQSLKKRIYLFGRCIQMT